MPDELKRLSNAATAYVWVQVGWQVAGLGLLGVAGWMLLELYESARPLIGG